MVPVFLGLSGKGLETINLWEQCLPTNYRQTNLNNVNKKALPLYHVHSAETRNFIKFMAKTLNRKFYNLSVLRQ